MAIRMIRRCVGGVEVLVPAGLEGMVLKIVRAKGESDADYYAAVSMYQRLFGDIIYVGDEDMTVHRGSGNFLADMGYENPNETRADFLATNSIETAAEAGELTDRAARERAVEEAIDDAARFGSSPSAMCREQMRLFVEDEITAEEMRKHVVRSQKMTKPLSR